MSQPSLFSFFKKLNNGTNADNKPASGATDSPKASKQIEKKASKEDKENCPIPSTKTKTATPKPKAEKIEKVVKIEADSSSKMDVDLYDNEDDDVKVLFYKKSGSC